MADTLRRYSVAMSAAPTTRRLRRKQLPEDSFEQVEQTGKTIWTKPTFSIALWLKRKSGGP